MFDLLAELNKIGFWQIVNTSILVLGSVASLIYWRLRKSRVRDLNFYITWKRDSRGRFPLILHFETRNLSQCIIVISSPYFVFDRARAGPYAHCDSATGQYEVKFKRSASDAYSEIACLLRHREVVTSYIPLDESQTDEELTKLSADKHFGTLYPGFPFWPWHGHSIHPRCPEYHVFSR